MTPQDLADLHAAAFTQGRPWSARAFRDLLDAPHCHLTPNAHGFALWRAIAGEAELLTIAVHPDHQGRGVGVALMRAWLSDAETLAETVFLEVAEDNAPSSPRLSAPDLRAASGGQSPRPSLQLPPRSRRLYPLANWSKSG